MRFRWKPIILTLALALLAWYVSTVDFHEAARVLSRVGGWAPLILVPYLIVYLVDSLAWAQTLPSTIRFRTLFWIRWAGESVNNTLPSGYVGGEAVKVWLLQRHGVSATSGTLSVVVSKTAQTIAQVLFILLASIAFLILARDQTGLRAGILFVLTGSILAVAALCWIQKVGVGRVAEVIARILPITKGWIEKQKDKLVEFDAAMLRFYRQDRPKFYKSTGLFLCGWLLDTLEIYLVAQLLDMPITWPQALVVEAFAGVAKVAGMWVPGSLGVQETGIVVLTRLVGAPDALGITYALIRRLRDLVFAAIGWFFLVREGNLRQIRAETATPAPAAQPDNPNTA